MNKTKKMLFIIVIVSFILLLSWIIINGIFNYEKIFYDFNPIILIIGIISYMILVCFFYKKIIPKIVGFKHLVKILFIIIAILLIASSLCFKVDIRYHDTNKFTWDMSAVEIIASDYSVSGKSVYDGYLLRFPNNAMITFIYTLIFKITTGIGISDTITTITVVNSLIVLASIMLMYCVTKKVTDEKKALMLLFIAMFTTPLYLYTAVYYSDTLSMLLVLLIIHLYLIMKDLKEPKLRVLLHIHLAVLIFIAMRGKSNFNNYSYSYNFIQYIYK